MAKSSVHSRTRLTGLHNLYASGQHFEELLLKVGFVMFSTGKIPKAFQIVTEDMKARDSVRVTVVPTDTLDKYTRVYVGDMDLPDIDNLIKNSIPFQSIVLDFRRGIYWTDGMDISIVIPTPAHIDEIVVHKSQLHRVCELFKSKE